VDFEQSTDAARITALLREELPAERIGERDFVKQVLLDPNFDPAGSILATDQGQAVGYVLAMGRRVPLENAPDDGHRGYITLMGVDARHRGKGIGAELLEQAEAFHRERGREEVWISPYAPGYFCPGVDVQAYAEGLEFLKRRGYQEVYRPIWMETSLEHYLAIPEWVQQIRARLESEGVLIVPMSPRFVWETLQFVERCFPGDWVRVVRHRMQEILDEWAGADHLYLAVDAQGKVIGFSHYDRSRFGPIGVDPDHRGRGIGQVLLHQTLFVQRSRNYTHSYFRWSDDRTAAKLYEGAGFQIKRRFALLKKTF